MTKDIYAYKSKIATLAILIVEKVQMSIIVKPAPEQEFLSSFAKSIGSTVECGRVIIPEKYGNGYVMGFLFGKQLRMVVRNYVLNEEVVITRHPDWLSSNMIMISLNNIIKSHRKTGNDIGAVRSKPPSVTITTKGFEPELNLPRGQRFSDIQLGIDAQYLGELLDAKTSHPVLKNIIANDQPLIFEQIVSVALQNTATEIAESLLSGPLYRFFYKVKAQELICYLLMELSKRKEQTIQAVNSQDIKLLYAIRDRIGNDLAKIPVLAELADYAGISESKLKRIFKQVFGENIYAYYQSLRMNEAAYLLKNRKMSVSEVGYSLGFSNLGHFARVFEQHIGLKPKKFSLFSV